MKKTLLLAALTMAAAPAFASKARLNALGNADHLDDIQRVFDRPYQAGGHGELATIEFGTNAAPSSSTTITAEGGFVRQMGDASYLGAYVGHLPTALTDASGGALVQAPNVGVLTSNQSGALFSTLNNAISVFYASKMGDMTWGAQLYYMSNNQNTNATVSTLNIKNRNASLAGVSFGLDAANFDVDLSVGLQGKLNYQDQLTEVQTNLNSTANYALHGTYKMDTLRIFGKYGMSSATASFSNSSPADAKIDTTSMAAGVIDSRKKDGTEFYYGATYSMTTFKGNPSTGDRKIEANTLPLIIGVEAEAASWLVLRGSVVQPLLGGNKVTATSATTGVTTVNTDNTQGSTIGAGAGFKFGKFTMDTFMAAATTGTVTLATDGTTSERFLTQASLTYMF